MSTLSIARTRSVMPALLASALVGTLLSGCADGRKAPTRQEYAVTNGVQAHAGNVVLRDLFLTADTGDTDGGATDLALQGEVANDTGSSDQLLAVSAASVALKPAAPSAAASASAAPSATPSAGASSTPASIPATVVPGVSLLLGTHGLGLQVSGLPQPVLPGALVPLTFSFQQAGQVTINVPVYALDSSSATPQPTTSFPTPDVPDVYNQSEFDNQAAPSS